MTRFWNLRSEKDVSPEEVIQRLHIRGVFDVVQKHAKLTGVPALQICGREVIRSISSARNLVWRDLHEQGLAVLEIARLFGRHHTTVLTVVNLKRRKKARLRSKYFQRLKRAAAVDAARSVNDEEADSLTMKVR